VSASGALVPVQSIQESRGVTVQPEEGVQDSETESGTLQVPVEQVSASGKTLPQGETTSGSSAITEEPTDAQAALIQVGSLEEPTNLYPRFRVAESAAFQNTDELASRLRIEMQHPNGTVLRPPFEVTHEQGEYAVAVQPGVQVLPGLYALTAVLTPARGSSRTLQNLFSNGVPENQDTVLLQTNVQWGTITLNTDSTRYTSGESVHLAITILSNNGNPLCSAASLRLTVTTPDGAQQSYGTETVRQPTECSKTALPVFLAEVPVTQDGEYTIAAIADIPDGERRVTQKVLVGGKEEPVHIRRSGSHAVGTGEQGEMQISITPSHTFVGTLTETVPEGVDVTGSEPLAVQENGRLQWNKQWDAGKTYTLRYTYRVAGDTAKVLLLGPADVRGTVVQNTVVPVEIFTDASGASQSSAVSSSTSAESRSSSGSVDSSAASSLVGTGSQSSSSAQSSQGILQSNSSSSGSVSSAGISEIGSSSSKSPVSEASQSSPAAEEPGASAESGAFSAFLHNLFRAVVPQVVAQDVAARELRFRESRQWQLISAHSIVGELLGLTSSGAVFRFLQEETEDAEGELVLEYVEDQDTFAMGEEPEFVIVQSLAASVKKSDPNVAINETQTAEKILGAIIADSDVETIVAESMVGVPGVKEKVASKLVEDTLKAGALQKVLVPDATRLRASTLGTVEEEVVKKLSEEAGAKKISAEAKEIVTVVVGQEASKKAKDAIIKSASEDVGTTQIVDTEKMKAVVREAVAMNEEAIDTLSTAIAEDAGVQDSAYAAAMDQEVPQTPVAKSASGNELISVTVTDATGNTVAPAYHFEEKNGSTVLILENKQALAPGAYKVSTTVRHPLTGEEQVFSRDFTWGVLAMNPNQDVYKPDDIVGIAIGVLDDAGEMVCDASVTLHVKEPDGNTFTLSTDDHSIVVSDTCTLYEAGLIDPDYETFFRAREVGVYELALIATTQNGTRKVFKKVLVEEDPAFTVARTAATRLWPAYPSPMTVEVRFREDFAGTITDVLPSGFAITEVGAVGKVTEGDDVRIAWKGSWSAGEKAVFTYSYDAPDISPEFYLVGPLQFETAGEVVHKERRSWQIANDTTITIYGTAYNDRGYFASSDFGNSLMGANRTIQLLLNGVAQTTQETDVSGNFTFNNVTVSKGTIITLYIKNETEKGVTVVVSSGAGTTQFFNIFKNHLYVRSYTGAVSVTNSILSTASDGSASVNSIYTVDSGVLNVKSGKNFFLRHGTTYVPHNKMNIGSGIILEGRLNPGEHTITFSGSWLKTYYGLLNAGTGTVVMNGVNQTLSGSNTFYSLKKVATGPDTLTLASGMRQAASGSLIVQGATGSFMNVRSSKSGAVAYMVLFGYSNAFQDIKRLRVQNTSASGSIKNRAVVLSCTKNCEDTPRTNERWTFVSYLVTGTLYSDEGLTTVAGKTISIHYNAGGIREQITSDAGGQFSLSGGILTGGTVVTLHADADATVRAVTVIVATGATMTGMSLYQNRLIVRSESGSAPVTNSHLAAARHVAGADADIIDLLSAASATSVTAAWGKELLVWANDTFQPRGTVVAHDVDINGTLDYQNNAIGVTGSWDSFGATSSGNATISFTSTGTETITSSGNTFNNVRFTGTGGSWTLTSNFDVNGSFTLLRGTFNQGAKQMNVSGNVLLTNSTNFISPFDDGLLILDGDLTYEDDAGVQLGRVRIGSSPDTVTLSGAMTVHKLTIGTGDTLVLSGHNLSVGTGGLFIHGTLDASNNGSNASVITVSGSWIASGTGDFIAGRSTVRFDGTSGSHTIVASGAFFNFIINGTGATYTATGSLDVDHLVQLSAGTFTATPGTMTLSGSWTKGANATFNHQSGSVVLDGGNQTVSGSTVFYNLTKSNTAGDTLTFSATTQTSVSGALTLNGTTSAKMLLRSSITGVQAYFKQENGLDQTLTFLNVQDNNAAGGQTMACTDCKDNTNNLNWNFLTPTVVGTLYNDEGDTPLAARTVSISYNGGAVAGSVQTDAGGQFTLSGANMTGGTIVTLFMQDEAEVAVTVVLSSGAAMTGISLFRDHLILRSESGSSAVTNAILALADDLSGTPDTDISNIYTMSSTALTVAAGKTLLLWNGSAYTPGDTVTVNGSGVLIQGNATYTAGSAATDINGTFILLGTFVHGTSTVNISGDVRIATGATFTRSGNDSILTFDGDLIYEDEVGTDIGYVLIGASPDVAVELSGSLITRKLTVGTGEVLTLSGHHLFVGTGGLYLHGFLDAAEYNAANSTITVSGSWIASGTGDFVSGRSTVLFDGTSGDYSIVASGSFFNFLVNGTGATYTATGGTFDINGNLQLSAGTFTSSSGTLTLSGSWTKGANATFHHNSGSVVLDGGDQTVSGSTVFYNFRKQVSSPQTLTFSATSQTSASGELLFTGVADNLLSIRSTESGVQAKLLLDAASGTQHFRYLDVKDSSAAGGPQLVCADCVDSGNNSNWAFHAVVGTVYSDEGTTPLADQIVSISYNGGTAADSTVTDAGGQFTLSGAAMTGGTIVALYLSSGTATGVTLLLASGSTMSGISLYQNRIILRSESGSVAVTNSHISVADNNGDRGITSVITSAASSAVTIAHNRELMVWTGDTYRPGGTVTVDDIDVNGSFIMGTNAVTVSGSWDATDGSFTSSGTVTFDSTSSEALTGNASTFSGVVFNGVGGTWTLQDALDVNGVFTLLNGTFAQNGQNMNVAGNLSVAFGAVFNAIFDIGVLTLDGDLSVNDASAEHFGLVQVGSSPDTVTLGNPLRVHKLTIGTGDTLVLSGYNLFVGTGGLYIHGTLDASNNGSNASTITVSGSWVASGTGDFIPGRSTVRFDGRSGSHTIVASGSFFNFIVNGTGATYTATGSLDINGNLQLSAGAFNAPPGTITLSGSWTKGGSATFNHSYGSVVLNGGNQTISGSTVFYNLSKQITLAQTLTFQSTAETSVSGALLLRGGSLTELLSLRPSNSSVDSLLTLSASGSQSLQFLDVAHSNAANGQQLNAVSSEDSNNNTNWTFSTPPISGTLYSDAGVTTLANRTIAISYNGGAVADTVVTDAGGQFSLSGSVMTGGTIITVFVQDEAENAVTVVLGSGGSMTGINLFRDHLIVRSESGSVAITNTDLTIADNLGGTPDTDITDIYTMSSTALTIPADKTLIVWTGSNYTPGAFVTVNGSGVIIQANATYTAGSAATDINGALTILGHFDHGMSTLNISGNIRIASGATFTESPNRSLVTLDGPMTIEDEVGISLGQVTMNAPTDTTFTLSGVLITDKLTLGTGEVLTLSGFNLFVGTGGLMIHGLLNAADYSTRSSAITVSGSWLSTGTGDFISGRSTVRFGARSKTYNIIASGSFFTFIINGTGATYVATGSTFDINGNVQLSAGTFTAPPGAITLSGSWTKGGSATFNHSFGSVTLNGGDQALSGSTVFYNLTKSVTSAQTLTFASTIQTSVSGALTLNGAAGNLLSLRSTQSGMHSKLIVDRESGSRTVRYLDVRDNTARNGLTLICHFCTDSGNNLNWAFHTISGTAYSDEGSTVASGTTVAVSFNGGTVTSTGSTDAGGQFILSGATMTGGTIITLYFDGGTATGVTVVLGSGSSMTGISLYQNRLILRSESGSVAVTNAHISVADNNADSSITALISSATSSAVTVSDGYELFLWSGDTYQPGGTVTVDDIDINGTFTADSNAVTVSGNWDATGGSFSSSGTVTFDSTSAETITSNGSAFSALTFNGAGGTWTLQDALDVNTSLSVLAGTLAQNTATLTVAGAVRIASGGSFTKSTNASLFTFDGYSTYEDEVGISIGAVGMSASPDITVTVSGSLVTDKLTIGTGETLTLSGQHLFVGTGGLYLHGLLNAANVNATAATIVDSGSWIASGTGDFVAGSSTVRFGGRSGSYDIVASGSFFNFIVNGTGATYTATGSLDINRNVQLSAGTFTAPPGVITLSGSWTKGGSATFNHGSGTLLLDGGDQSFSGSTTFFNLTKSGSTAHTLTFSATASVSVSGALILRGAAFSLLSIRSSITGVEAYFQQKPGQNQTLHFLDVKDNNASGGQTMDCSECTDSTNNTNWLFAYPTVVGTLYSDEGVTELPNKTVAISFNGGLIASTAMTDAGGQFTLSGAAMTGGTIVTLFVDNESEDAAMVLLSQGISMTGIHLYQNRLIIRSESGSAPVTNAILHQANQLGGTTDDDLTDILSSTTSSSAVVAISRELLVWTGSTFRPGGAVTTYDLDTDGIFDFQNNAVTLKGSWDTTGGTASGTSTITFVGTGAATITSDGHQFHAITFNGPGGTWTPQDALDINGVLTVQQGTLSQGATTLNASANIRFVAGAAFSKSTNGTAFVIDSDMTYEDEADVNLGIVEFSAAPYTITLSGSLRADKLTVGTGDTLLLSGSNLFIGSNGLFIHGVLDASNNGSDASLLSISGSWLATGTGDFIAGRSTVRFDGDTGSHTIIASGSFFNFIVNGTGATYTATGSLDINGNVHLSAGTFVAPLQETTTLSGSWTKGQNATFNHNSGTLLLNGGDQVFSGSSIFNNLTKSGASSGDTLTFPATEQQSISGALTLTGTDEENKLVIRSTISGVQAKLFHTPGASQTVQYVDVKDNDASGGAAIDCTDCTNRGNNTNWFFVTPTIVGSLYSDEGTTPLAGKAVAISYNGGSVADTAETDAGGQFTLSGASMTGGSVLTLFVQGETQDAITVVLGSGGAMTGISLYQNRLIVRSESGSAAVTNTHLIAARSTTASSIDDITNILESAAATGVTIATTKELLIFSGSTFRPGSALTVHDLDINGTFSIEQNAVEVTGSWDTDATTGSFSGTGAVTFTSVGSETIRSGGNAFRTLIINNTSGTWTLQDALDVDGPFTLSGGVFSRGNNTIHFSGDVRFAAGVTFEESPNESLLTLDGSLTFEDETVVNLGIVHIGVGTDTVTLSGSLRARKLSVGTGDTLVLSGGNLYVGTGGLTLYGSLDASDNGSDAGTVTLSGSWLATGTGDFIHGHSSVVFEATSGTHVITSSGAFYNLIFSGTGGTWTPSNTLDVNGNLTLSAGTLTAPSTITLSGSLLHGANFTFNHNSGLFHLDGSSQTLSGSIVFYNLRKTTGIASTLTLSAGSDFAVSGSLVLRGSDANHMISLRSTASGSQAFLTVDSTGNYSAIYLDVKDNSAGHGQEITCVSCTDGGNNTNWVFTSHSVAGTLYSDEGVHVLSGKTIVFAKNGGSATATGTTDAGGQYVISGVTLTGGTIITLYVNNADEDAVVVVLGSGGTMTGIDLYQNRLIVRSESGTSAITKAHLRIADDNGGATADSDVTNILAAATNDVITIAPRKELLVWSGSTFAPGAVLNVENIDINGTLQQVKQNIFISGTWDSGGGTFTSEGTVTFSTATSSGQVILARGTAFSGVTISGTGTWFPRSSINIDGPFTLASGTFAQSGSTVSISGKIRVASGAMFLKSTSGSVLTLDGDLSLENETSLSMGVVYVGNTADTVTLSGAVRFDKLTIGTGNTLVLSGSNLFVGTGGLFIHGLLDATNDGTQSAVLTVSGSWLATGTGDFIPGTSTVRFAARSGTYNIVSSGSFFNFIVNGTGATYTATGALDINGNVHLSAGTFTAPLQETMTVSGSWTKGGSATFNHHSGSVVLDGASQTISGSSVFNNLTKSGSSTATLTFSATEKTSISGSFILRGTAQHQLLIRSSISDVSAHIALDTGGSETLQYLNVKDSDASAGQPLTCNSCTNAGGNVNWLFPSPTITGVFYSDEGVTPVPNKTIAMSVNGGAIIDRADTGSGGEFTLSGAIMTGGTVISLFVNNETENAVTIVLGSGSAMTGIYLYQNRVILRSESGSSPVTLTTLDIANALIDNDIITLVPVTISPSYLHMPSGIELLIWTGSTFQPTADITVDDIDVDGTLSYGANALYVKGSWDSGSGTVTGTGTVDFEALGTAETIRSGSFTYSGAVFSGSGSWTLQDAFSVDGFFDFQKGTLHQGAAAMTLSNNVHIARGVSFVKSTNGSALTLDASSLYEDEQGVNLGQVTMAASPDVTITLSGSFVSDALTIGIGDTFTLSGGNLSVGTGGLAMQGLLDASNSSGASVLTLSGSWEAAGTGGFIAGASTVRFNASAGSHAITASGAFYNLIINGTGATYLPSTSLDVNGIFQLSAGTFRAPTSLTVSGSWTKGAAGTFLHNSGSVVLDGGDQAISGSTLFNNLTKTVTTARQLTFSVGTLQSVSGALTLRGADGALLSLRPNSGGVPLPGIRLDATSGTQNLAYLNVQGNDARGGKKLYCYTGCIDAGNNLNWAFHPITGTLYSDEGTTPLAGRTVAYTTNGSAVIATAETGTGGQFILTGASLTGGTIITLFVRGEAEHAAMVLLGSGGSMTGIDLYQDHLIVRSESGSVPMTNTHIALGDSLNGTLDSDLTSIFSGSLITGLTVQKGKELLVWEGTLYKPNSALSVHDIDVRGTLQTLTGGTITVSGSWDVLTGSGRVVAGSGTVVFTATGAETIYGNGQPFHNVVINGSGTLTVSGSLNVDGNFTLLQGTFVAPATGSVLTLSGSWFNIGTGTFLHNTGSVVLDGYEQTVSGSTVFYSLTKIVQTTTTLYFAASETQSFSGSLTLKSALSYERLYIRSTRFGALAQLNLDADNGATQDLEYLSVVDSDARPGITLSCKSACTGSNYFNWTFPSAVPTPTSNGGGGGSAAVGGGAGGGGGGGGGGGVVEQGGVKHMCISFGRPLSAPFEDIEGHWAENDILQLQKAHLGNQNVPVIRGRMQQEHGVHRRLFFPDEEMTRYEMTELVVLSNCIPLAHNPQDFNFAFSDVPSSMLDAGVEELFRRRVVYTAVDLGLIKGYPDGSFRPNEPISRGEAMKMIVLAAELPPLDGEPQQMFSDVSLTDKYAPFVERAVFDRLIDGYSDGTFRPLAPLLRGEAAHAIYQVIAGSEDAVDGELRPAAPTLADEDLREQVFAAPKECLLSGTPVTPPFVDINDHWAYPMIQRLARTKTITGNTPLTKGYLMQQGDRMYRFFQPDKQISRYELLKLAALSNCMSLVHNTENLPYNFSDILKAGRTGEQADVRQKREVIYSAVEKGIVEGYADGTFRPDAPVTRAEAVKILMNTTDLPKVDTYKEQFFTDVPLFEWYAPYVHQAATYGLVSGYGDGTFRPSQPMTRAEMAKMINIIIASSGHMPAGFSDPVEPPMHGAAPDLSASAVFVPESALTKQVALQEPNDDLVSTPMPDTGDTLRPAAPAEDQEVLDDAALLLKEAAEKRNEERSLLEEERQKEQKLEELAQGRQAVMPEVRACLVTEDAPITTFGDVQEHWSRAIVERLASTRVSYSALPLIGNGSQMAFSPEQPITRYNFIRWALLGNCLPLVEDTQQVSRTFSDVPKNASATESEAMRERRRVIYTAAYFMLVSGRDDGTFHPDDPITRVEALKILLRASGIPPVLTGETEDTGFSDVPFYEWYAPYVHTAVFEGLANGYRDGSFHPADFLRRAEAAKMLDAAMQKNASTLFTEAEQASAPQEHVVDPTPEVSKEEETIPEQQKHIPEPATVQLDHAADAVLASACLSPGNPLTPEFSDVTGHWIEPITTFLSRVWNDDAGTPLLQGYLVTKDGVEQRMFAPNKPITRYELLRFAFMSKCVDLVRDVQDVPLRFTDVSKTAFLTGDAALKRRVVYTAADLGITLGYRDGTFKPDVELTRAEALKILILTAGLPPVSGGPGLTFSDVKPDAWYAPYVERAVYDGFISGFPDGTFRPDAKITRAEALKVLYVLLGN